MSLELLAMSCVHHNTKLDTAISFLPPVQCRNTDHLFYMDLKPNFRYVQVWQTQSIVAVVVSSVACSSSVSISFSSSIRCSSRSLSSSTYINLRNIRRRLSITSIKESDSSSTSSSSSYKGYLKIVTWTVETDPS